MNQKQMGKQSVKQTFSKNWRQRINIEVVTSAVFLVMYRDKRTFFKASYVLWF